MATKKKLPPKINYGTQPSPFPNKKVKAAKTTPLSRCVRCNSKDVDLDSHIYSCNNCGHLYKAKY